MVKLNIRDKNFGGEPSSCHKGVNKFIEWEFNNNLVSNSVFITDLCLEDVVRARGAKRKIAWILEPRAIHPQVYDWIEKNNRLFDYVLTFDLDLVDRGENFLYYPHGRCWIPNPTVDQTRTWQQVNEFVLDVLSPVKTKTCSIIASSKQSTIGHRLRHEVIRTCKQENCDVDVFGYGYCPIEDKSSALYPYRFSITIENSIQRGYWTEKIVDCFATFTIPIFWGDKEGLSKHFNTSGIIFASSHKDIMDIVAEVQQHGESMYRDRIEAVISNYKRVETYRIPEDWIFNNYPFLCN